MASPDVVPSAVPQLAGTPGRPIPASKVFAVQLLPTFKDRLLWPPRRSPLRPSASAPPKLGHVRSRPGLGLSLAPRLEGGPGCLLTSSLPSFFLLSYFFLLSQSRPTSLLVSGISCPLSMYFPNQQPPKQPLPLGVRRAYYAPALCQVFYTHDL